MTYTYGHEYLSEARPEFDALIVDHYKEIGLQQDKIPLAPMWTDYEQLERKQSFLLMCVRKEGALVGYAAWFLKMHMHYGRTLVAMNDVIYLKPECRRGRVGIKLIEESEYLLKVLGVDKIFWHIKVSHDWSAILKRKGYAVEDIVLGKYTGE